MFRSPVFASGPVLATKFFTPENKILYGSKVDYSIKIPNSWLKHVTAEFEKTNSKNIVEKVNFYYNPKGKVNSPVLFLSINVFNKEGFTNAPNYTLIKQNSNYVFASTNVTTNPFTLRDDKVVFGILITDSSNDKFLKSMLTVPTETDEKCTVTVNSIRLNNKVIVRSGSLCFFPIKEICESLGYSVTWDNKNSCVAIKGGNNYYKEFYPNQPSKNSGYSVIINNGTSYINSFYFIWDLGVNFEIDDEFNTYITT